MTTKIIITINDFKELDKVAESTKKYLTTPDGSGKPWFQSKEECEEWMGDVFYDAVEHYMKCLGIEITGQDFYSED